MSIEVKVPDLPESVADGMLMSWHKSVGDQVSRDESLVDIETDKVVLEIPAPGSGVIKKILKADGAVVSSGEVLAIIEEAVTDASEQPASSKAESNQMSAKQQPVAAPMSPAVRKLIADNQLDAAQIAGSGKSGRITKQDVVDFMSSSRSGSRKSGRTESASIIAETMAFPSMPVDGSAGDRAEERVPMTRLRARIAERLVQSQQTAAILTTFNEVNMQPVMDLRSRCRDRFEKEHDTKLGFMSFFVRACTDALKKFPVVNASIDGSDIIYHGYYDIGIAVGSPRGLVVPVLRNTDTMSFAEIENTIRDYGTRAQDGKLTLDELAGGTFSITNGGIFGSMLSTPIINPPQSAILGMHNIQQRAMVVDGEIVAQPVMYLALSYDHRIIDGREAVQFLVSIKQSLEDPASMLLGL